jgi:hypothetical protein
MECGIFVATVFGGCVGDLGVREIFWRAAWLADTGASHSKQAAQLSRGLLCLLCA